MVVIRMKIIALILATFLVLMMDSSFDSLTSSCLLKIEACSIILLWILLIDRVIITKHTSPMRAKQSFPTIEAIRNFLWES